MVVQLQCIGAFTPLALLARSARFALTLPSPLYPHTRQGLISLTLLGSGGAAVVQWWYGSHGGAYVQW